METNITLVVLMGLPGSGKSTLCETIHATAKKKPEFQNFSFIHVSYDAFIPLAAQEKFAEAKQIGIEEETDSWKNARRDVFVNVDKFICCLKANLDDSFILDLFKINRDCLQDFSKIVILLDDNFYYRSMRYEYFQLARRHTLGFCQVFVDIDVNVAIERNLKRANKVPVSVINNMMHKLQPPKPLENNWESSTLVYSNQSDLQGFWSMVMTCMSSPILSIECNDQEREEARLVCSQNVAHQADLYLRSLVGKVIKDSLAKGDTKGMDNRAYASYVNNARQNVMSSIQNGSVLFPPHLAVSVDDNNKDEFQEFVAAEFKKIL